MHYDYAPWGGPHFKDGIIGKKGCLGNGANNFAQSAIPGSTAPTGACFAGRSKCKLEVRKLRQIGQGRPLPLRE